MAFSFIDNGDDDDVEEWLIWPGKEDYFALLGETSVLFTVFGWMADDERVLISLTAAAANVDINF